MKNGKCPICNASDVYTNSESEFRASGSLLTLTDIDNELEIDLAPYICIKCGFAAMFVPDLDQLRELPQMQNWERVK